jgi:hypothetical protein
MVEPMDLTKNGLIDLLTDAAKNWLTHDRHPNDFYCRWEFTLKE